jgi:AhpD family alkylhydroperoxidase
MLSIIIRNSAAAAAVALVGLASVPAYAEDKPNAQTFADIEQNFGSVPNFLQTFPEAKLPGLWNAYKSVQLNPNTALDAKTKQLIAVAVAASNNCSACVYFQTSAAIANGASGAELQEAVAISVVGNTWGKLMNAAPFDMIKKDTNTLVAAGTLKAKPATN